MPTAGPDSPVAAQSRTCRHRHPRSMPTGGPDSPVAAQSWGARPGRLGFSTAAGSIGASLRVSTAVCCILGAAAMLTACGGGGGQSPQTLDELADRWRQAVSEDQPEQLFNMLDARSRQAIAHQLQRLRGLDQPAQQAVVDQLGGMRLSDLSTMSAQQYFARLWHHVTDGRRPTLTVQQRGEDWAAMHASLGPQRTLELRVMRQAGRWVWQLPAQALAPDRLSEPQADQ